MHCFLIDPLLEILLLHYEGLTCKKYRPSLPLHWSCMSPFDLGRPVAAQNGMLNIS